MAHDIKESDWKRFREVHPIALERFAERCLAEINYFLTDKSKDASDRFAEIGEVTRERQKELSVVFGDFRRSTALMQLAAMRLRKLVTDEEMATFSPQMRDAVEGMLKIGG